MGIVAKQTIKGSIFLYLGILLGGLNVTYLFPQLLGESNWGNLSILLSIVELGTQISQLGTPNIILKYFPAYRDGTSPKGFYNFLILTNLGGAVLCALVFVIWQDSFIGTTDLDLSNAPLLVFGMICWVIAISALNNITAIINMHYETAYSTFLREFLLRVFQTLGVLLFFVYNFSFTEFYFVYILSFILASSIGLIYLFRKKYFQLSFLKEKTNKLPIKEYFSYGIYSIIGNFGINFLLRIDIIMIGALMLEGSVNAGQYRTSVYIATLCIIPLRPFIGITQSLISNWWPKKAVSEIQNMYTKSSFISLIVSSFGLVFILINLPWIGEYLFSKDIEVIFYVILAFGIGQVFNSTTTVNGYLISLSSFYKFNTYSIAVLIGISALLNYILISAYGIVGAAVATTIGQIIYNLMKTYYLKIKLGYRLNAKQLIYPSLIVATLLIAVTYFMQRDWLGIINALVLSTFIGAGLLIYIYYFSDILEFLKRKKPKNLLDD